MLEAFHRLALKEGQKENKKANKMEIDMSFRSFRVLLVVLGGTIAILESIMVLAFTSGTHGLADLAVATLILAGFSIAYKGFRTLGIIVVFLSSLIGQLTGGTIGFVLAVFLSPPPPPFFNETFVVSRWTLLSLLGSILLLFAVWKNREKPNDEKNS